MYFEHSAEGKYCALDYGESHKSGELELAGHARPGRFGCAFFRLPIAMFAAQAAVDGHRNLQKVLLQMPRHLPWLGGCLAPRC